MEETQTQKEELEIKLPHLGPGVKVKPEFTEPKVKHWIELEKYNDNRKEQRMMTACLTIKINGKIQPREWWEDLTMSEWDEFELYLLRELAKLKKDSGSGEGDGAPLD